MSKRYKVVIAGAGGMGSAAGLLLRELGDFEVDVYIGDSHEARARTAAAWIREGSERPGEVFPFLLPASGSSPVFAEALEQGDILLDCLPGDQAPRLASLARRYHLHYANLTEYVEETEQVRQIAAGAEQGFLLQTGLAPGFVDVLANGLYQRFCREHGTTQAESLTMRVGALTANAHPPHYYGFTWSPIGVATEYIKPATVVRDFARTTRPSLSDLATIVLHGVRYEEALTSGGAADLPDVLAGKIRNLDYKTLRYPGHYAWVQSLLAEAPEGSDRTEYLQARMAATVPLVEDDQVVIYSAVEGRGADGNLHRLERSFDIHPLRVGARQLKAIQATTASSLAEAARLLLTDGYQGACLQSQIDPAKFMAGPFVGTIYLGHPHPAETRVQPVAG
ncbi:MAG TPA: saccharopine dehydrogenase C-terminal domain-containing protein [Thermoanaerobaculia bacterium]|jgi:saccharopine dehydrogenase-like NADP-dependent oxidoreductase|nr:saccharopine dehydrogenase C-terminal domain-containing protein [Thermoanaerobaculia bacterium]